jgi:hypothetical protein
MNSTNRRTVRLPMSQSANEVSTLFVAEIAGIIACAAKWMPINYLESSLLSARSELVAEMAVSAISLRARFTASLFGNMPATSGSKRTRFEAFAACERYFPRLLLAMRDKQEPLIDSVTGCDLSCFPYRVIRIGKGQCEGVEKQG